MSRHIKFKPEPYSQGPHANAAHDAGGKLIGVPMPSRERFNADLAAHAPGCGSPIPAVDGLPAEGIRCGQLGNDGNALLCPHCKGIGESREMEATANYPDDFQVLLFDYLEPLGFTQLPAKVPVKWVPAYHYRAQAEAMGYSYGDNRSNPAYLKAMRTSISSGGSMPPILIKGSELIDGRHRLLADGRSVVKAIDLADLRRQRESRAYQIVNTLLEADDFDSPEQFIPHHIDKRAEEIKRNWDRIAQVQRMSYKERAETLKKMAKQVSRLNRNSSMEDRNASVSGLFNTLNDVSCMSMTISRSSGEYPALPGELEKLDQAESLMMSVHEVTDAPHSGDAVQLDAAADILLSVE